MTNVSKVAESLRAAGAALAEAAEALLATTEEDSTTQSEPPQLPDVRALLADLSRSGHTDEVRELIRKYGAEKLSDVSPKNYEALMHDAEELKNA